MTHARHGLSCLLWPLILLVALTLRFFPVARNEAKTPVPPRPDLGFDVRLLTSDEALLYAPSCGEVRMSRRDFDRMFGTLHVEPLPPEKQQ